MEYDYIVFRNKSDEVTKVLNRGMTNACSLLFHQSLWVVIKRLCLFQDTFLYIYA